MKDKKEVEIRFQIDSTMEERIRSSLLQIGWVSGKIMSQTDTYFCATYYMDNKITNDCPYVVRTRESEQGSTLTYKSFQGNADGGWVEIESAVNDISAIKDILRNIGQVDYLLISKQRLSGTIDDVEVNIDYVENLGLFVEMEIFDQNVNLGRRKLLSLAEKIGLSEENIETRGYVQLMEEKMRS